MSPSVIHHTKKDLCDRRRAALRSAGLSEQELRRKIEAGAPLTDKEWAAAEELAMVDFLLLADAPEVGPMTAQEVAVALVKVERAARRVAAAAAALRQAVQEAGAAGASVSDVARSAGVGRQTIYRWNQDA